MRMKFKNYFFLIFIFFGNFLYSQLQRCELLEDNFPLVYYLEIPESESYPLMIAIEGSYVSKKGPESVLRLHHIFAKPFLDMEIGLITLERKGMDGSFCDENIFHQYNFPSQRLKDHLTLIQHLKNNPPKGWNGQLIVMGGSEGGPLAIKLADKINPIICIALVGCGDQTFKDYIWNTIQAIQSSNNWFSRKFINYWCELPSNKEEYEKLCELFKANPDPNQWWFGQTYLYWSDALDQSEYAEFLRLKCSCLVIAGTKDIEYDSTKRLIDKALKNKKDLTFWEIENMGHDVLDPQWEIITKIQDYLKNKLKIVN